MEFVFIYIYKIKGITVGSKFPVVGSTLVVAYEEIKMFTLLSQLHSQHFVDVFR